MIFSGPSLINTSQVSLVAMATMLQQRNPVLFSQLASKQFGIDLAAMEAPEMGASVDALAKNSMAHRKGSVAIVRVYGPLGHRSNGYTYSYEEFERDLDLAASDEFDAVVLEIDSPGGVCTNLDEAAKRVQQLNELKPVHALINGVGCSAAYWIASAAEKVFATRTSMVGSVGSVISYTDMDGIFAKLGATKIEVTASQSPNKRLDPQSDEGQAELQAIVDDAGQMFIDALADFKGVSAEHILENFGQGLVFSAPDALERGMIDGIMSMEQVLAGFAARPDNNNQGGRSATATTSQEHTDMPNEQAGGNKPTSTVAERVTALNASDPELVAAIASQATEGQQALIDAAAKQERDRIAGIGALAQPGCEKLIQEMQADGKTTPEQAALRIMNSDDFKKGQSLVALKSDDELASGATPAPNAATETNGTVAQTPEGWTAEWEASDALRGEFVKAEHYVAFKKREAKG